MVADSNHGRSWNAWAARDAGSNGSSSVHLHAFLVPECRPFQFLHCQETPFLIQFDE